MEGAGDLGRLAKLSKLWGILMGIIVIGLLAYIGLLYMTSQQITADVKDIESIVYSPATETLRITFIVEVNNSGYIDVSIEKLCYEIYVEGEFLGSGYEETIFIYRGSNEIRIHLDTTLKQSLASIITIIVNRGNIDVTIKGKIVIPIKSFNLIKLWDAEIPFEETWKIKFTIT